MQPGQICHVDLRPGVSDGEICQVDMRPEGFRSHVRSHVAMRYDLGSGAIQHWSDSGSPGASEKYEWIYGL